MAPAAPCIRPCLAFRKAAGSRLSSAKRASHFRKAKPFAPRSGFAGKRGAWAEDWLLDCLDHLGRRVDELLLLTITDVHRQRPFSSEHIDRRFRERTIESRRITDCADDDRDLLKWIGRRHSPIDGNQKTASIWPHRIRQSANSTPQAEPRFASVGTGIVNIATAAGIVPTQDIGLFLEVRPIYLKRFAAYDARPTITAGRKIWNRVSLRRSSLMIVLGSHSSKIALDIAFVFDSIVGEPPEIKRDRGINGYGAFASALTLPPRAAQACCRYRPPQGPARGRADNGRSRFDGGRAGWAHPVATWEPAAEAGA